MKIIHSLTPVVFLASSFAAFSQVSVTTYHNNRYSTGQNPYETLLTPANVSATTFGKLFSQPVDGQIYAQPLYMQDVSIVGKGMHNVVFVATENDDVYAFDADNNTGSNSAPLWKAVFTGPNVTPVSNFTVSNADIYPVVGITGTPVIHEPSGTLYVVAKTFENGTTVVQRLHALDIHSGQEKLGGPFEIAATAPGACSGGTQVEFDPLRNNQRAGLILADSILPNHGLPGTLLYVTWASHGDYGTYVGWIIAFNPATGQPVLSLPISPAGCRGGIWQSGAAPAFDNLGNMFLATGNGTFNANTGGADFGDSVIRVVVTPDGLKVKDYFTPYDQATMALYDTDLGSGGLMLLPKQPGAFPNLAVLAGKNADIYLLNRDNLGKFNATGDSQIVQKLSGSIGAGFGPPAYFANTLFFGSTSSPMKAFPLTNGLLPASPASESTHVFSWPPPVPAVSSKGNANPIVWAIDSGGWSSSAPGVLYAFDAANLAHELYDSAQNPARDQSGPAVKFVVPTIANGKVYVGSCTSVDIFGLL